MAYQLRGKSVAYDNVASGSAAGAERLISGQAFTSPTLDTNIGSAYVKLGHDEPGRRLELDVRGKRQACTVQDLPFFSRTRK